MMLPVQSRPVQLGYGHSAARLHLAERSRSGVLPSDDDFCCYSIPFGDIFGWIACCILASEHGRYDKCCP